MSCFDSVDVCPLVVFGLCVFNALGLCSENCDVELRSQYIKSGRRRPIYGFSLAVVRCIFSTRDSQRLWLLNRQQSLLKTGANIIC